MLCIVLHRICSLQGKQCTDVHCTCPVVKVSLHLYFITHISCNLSVIIGTITEECEHANTGSDTKESQLKWCSILLEYSW